nr:hypothetical protein [uncultured Carboxylicivirga sp.]
MNHNGLHRTFWIGILLVFLFLSCSKESYNIIWNGTLLDADSHLPIPFTEIQTTTLHQTNIDYSKKEAFHHLSNESGKFTFKIDKAYQVSVLIESNRHKLYHKSFLLGKTSLPDTIYLKKAEDTNDLHLHINKKGFNKEAPFISQRFLTRNSSNTELPVQTVGFDIIQAQRNSQIYDLSLKIKTTNNRYDLELNSHGKGGIIPVLNNQINESFFLEMEKAPLMGYQKTYKIKGKEAGFFVRCRDGKHITKVIFDSKIYQLKITNQQDTISELGLKFNYILQNDSNNYTYFPAVDILEQLNKEQLTSILDTSKSLNQ